MTEGSSEDYVPAHAAPKAGPVSNKLYDAVKFCALIAFPAFGALYYGLAGIWGLPAAEQVVGTVVVVDTFLGVLVGLTKAQYVRSDARFDGSIRLEEGEDPETTNLNVRLDPEAVATKKEITVKINRP